MSTLFYNATVFTGTQSSAEAFVVSDGRFSFVGSLMHAILRSPYAQRVDLGGRFVCAGFNDSHMHLLNLGLSLGQAQLDKPSLNEVLLELESFAKLHPDLPFIQGRGFNEDHYLSGEKRFAVRDELDAACPDKPCMITRVCGHVAVANSKALEMAGISSRAPYVEGGSVDTDENGRPTGILRENAIFLVSSIIPKPDRNAIKECLMLAMERVNRYGVTSVQTDDFSSLDVPFEEILRAYQELKNEGLMRVRVTEQCFLPTLESLNAFLRAGYISGAGDEWLRIGPLKLLADGSLGARTAYLRNPYSDAPDTRGIPVYTKDSLSELILSAHHAGMQIAVHTIGDGAVEMALDAFGKAQASCRRPDARHGLVHAQIVDSAQADAMAELHLHAYIQSIFLDYDTRIVSQRLGSRAQEAYPAASLLRRQATLSNGSDCPVEPPDVLAGIQCAVTRKPYTPCEGGAYLPHESLSISDALKSFTSWGAYASFEEDKKGLIQTGYLADFVVLDANPFKTASSSLHSIPIWGVYLAGNRIL